MFLRHIYDEKLAQSSYLVACPATGEALVIDPARNIQPYLDIARQHGLQLTAAAETHIHADFVSGARELAERHDVTLLLSAEGEDDWQYTYLEDYNHAFLQDGDTFEVGSVNFTVYHTPGHTPEHLMFKVAAGDQDYGLFTGDFVFVGDLGRPDLLEKVANQPNTADKLARQMFHSAQAFKQHPDYLLVFPGHGAGSACGKSLGAVPSSTVGYETRFNPMLQYDDEDAFVAALLDGLDAPPAYFARVKNVNKTGPKLLTDVTHPETLPPVVLKSALSSHKPIIDTRPRHEFAAKHIPGTINIESGFDFPNRAGQLLDYNTPFFVITDESTVIWKDLQSIGLDNYAGYFPTSTFKTLVRAANLEFEHYDVRPPTDLAADIQSGQMTVVDVRDQSEWNAGHIPDALHIPLGNLANQLESVPSNKPIVVHCATGVRSAVAASILQANGIKDVTNIDGGFDAWENADLPTTTD